MEVVLAFVVLAQAVLLAWAGARWVRDALRAPALEARPITPIAKLRPGQRARIRGRVSVDAPLTSPITQRPCAAWRLGFHAQATDPAERTVLEERGAAPFRVRDGTGECVVDVAAGSLVLELERGSRAEVGESILAVGAEVELFGVAAIVEVDGEPSLALLPDAADRLVVTPPRVSAA